MVVRVRFMFAQVSFANDADALANVAGGLMFGPPALANAPPGFADDTRLKNKYTRRFREYTGRNGRSTCSIVRHVPQGTDGMERYLRSSRKDRWGTCKLIYFMRGGGGINFKHSFYRSTDKPHVCLTQQ